LGCGGHKRGFQSSLAGTSQRDMRPKPTALILNTQMFHPCIDALRQSLEIGSNQTRPENSWRPCTGKETDAFHGNLKRLPRESRHVLMNIFKQLLVDFAKKLQCQMDQWRRNPFCGIRHRLEFALNNGELLSNVIRQIYGNKRSHYISNRT